MTAPTTSQCESYGNKLRDSINSFYDERVSGVTKKINSEIAAGRDPKAWKPSEGVTIDLYAVRKAIDVARKPALDDATKRQSECLSGSVPNWVGDAQKILDIGVTIAMLPFIAIFKSYKEHHVDLTEIYKGQPLGGENALLPKARDDILRELQITGDVAKILKDPINTIGDVVSDAGGAIEEFLDSIFGGWRPQPVLI